LPLVPLLNSYVATGLPGPGALGRLPGLGPRFAAVLSATARFLSTEFLDRAPDADLSAALVRFYEAVVQPPLHVEALRRRVGVVRHGLAYLLRGLDPLPRKADGCLSPSGPYYVAGLGPAFWSALIQGVQPKRRPAWTPAVVAGLRRLGLARWERGDGPGAVYAALQRAYAEIQALRPGLSALHVDHFLSLVAAMDGRNLHRRPPDAGDDPVTAAVRRERCRTPLRDRLKHRGAAAERARQELEAGLAARDGARIGAALAEADPAGAARSPLDWPAHGEALTLWVGRLWESDDPYSSLSAFWEADPLPGAGLWLPAAVLHLRDPQQFQPWNEEARRGYAALADGAADEAAPAERYRLFNEGVARLRALHHLHPVEAPAVLAAVAEDADAAAAGSPPAFGGFCADTFLFLAELAANNRRDWMEARRERYRFAVREPLVELCRALAERYVKPVVGGVHGWDLDAEPRSGRALTSICKNSYGRTGPYNTVLWIAFCRKGAAGRHDVQLFVRLDAAGLRFGVRVSRKAREAGRRLRRCLHEHADLAFRALRDAGALADCRFGRADGADESRAVADADGLRAWADVRSFEASRALPPERAATAGDELVGDVLLTFDRLLPLFACAASDDPAPFLFRRAGTAAADRFTDADFRRATFLGDDWLQRARGLLELKRQLILQGVPGAGKTHVARCLARLLTGGRDDAVRLVQFHPSYSYEEFVEGVKVRTVERDGRHDVTYPVEDGLLCAFAAAATERPAEPHVLVVDEINRGNLPRIFGELLYLLEYRGQEVVLPYSRRPFRLPPNLYLIGTMNAADRSVALVDQALRRRFSFIDMPPDAGVLAAWLKAHPPAAGPAFAERVVSLFGRLNDRLRSDLGPQAQVGHSYFMAPDLDEERLRMVWRHHVRPLLDEHFLGQPARAAAYDLDALLEERPRRKGRRKGGRAAVNAPAGREEETPS
jgi:hypothetical protein